MPGWTESDLIKLNDASRLAMTLPEAAAYTGHSEAGVKKKLRKSGLSYGLKHKFWSDGEISMFINDWATSRMSLRRIARKYGRSPGSLAQMAVRLNLGPRYSAFSHFTINDICHHMNVKPDVVRGWMKIGLNSDFIRAKKAYVISSEDFMEFIKAHPDRVNCANIKGNMFMPCPDWLKTKIMNDQLNTVRHKSKGDKYTDSDRYFVRKMFNDGKSDADIAHRLNRTETAIKIYRQKQGLLRKQAVKHA